VEAAAVAARMPGPAPGGQPGPELAVARIPDRPVALRALAQLPGLAGVAQSGRELRGRAVRERVLERGRGALVQVVVAVLGEVVAGVEGHVAEPRVVRVAHPAERADLPRRHLRRVAVEQPEHAALMAAQQALRPAVDQERRRRIAGHHVRVARGHRPARQPAAVLLGVGDQRELDVARDVGDEQLQQLVLRPVGVPQGEVRVLGPAAGPVHPAVEARVAAVDVGERRRRELRAVQRRVERGALVGRPAVDLHAAERLRPRGLGAGADGVEVEPGRLGGEVALRALGVDVAERDLGQHRGLRPGIEAHVRAVALVAPAGAGLAAAGVDPAVAPRPVRGEGPVERRGEVHRVAVGRAAEVPAGHLALDLAVADHADRGAERGGVGLADVDQHVRLVGGRERVAMPAGARRRGELGTHAVAGERHAVVAGMGRLRVVRVGGRVAVRAGVVDVARRRHERHVAHRRAAGAGQVRVAEPLDPAVAVLVPRRVTRVRGELDHPERRGRPGKRVALVLGADERVHDRAERHVRARR
jgi:hypothetical protein